MTREQTLRAADLLEDVAKSCDRAKNQIMHNLSKQDHVRWAKKRQQHCVENQWTGDELGYSTHL